ncbi:pyruvate dehydrogenase (acetyl-transferring) E1 component subunit alpha, partial [Rhizobium sp. KAs_5_22]
LDVDIEEIFDHTYAVLPAELEEQKQEAIAYFKSKGAK